MERCTACEGPADAAAPWCTWCASAYSRPASLGALVARAAMPLEGRREPLVAVPALSAAEELPVAVDDPVEAEPQGVGEATAARAVPVPESAPLALARALDDGTGEDETPDLPEEVTEDEIVGASARTRAAVVLLLAVMAVTYGGWGLALVGVLLVLPLLVHDMVGAAAHHPPPSVLEAA